MAANGEQQVLNVVSEQANDSRTRIEALFKENYSGLRLLILKSAQNEAVAADILNDAVATALEHLQAGRIAQPEQIAGYVYQVAMNLLRNHRRKMDERGDRRVDSDTIENIAGEGESADSLFANSVALQVRRVISELPTDRDRAIVKRFYLDEEDKEVICRELNLSVLHFDKVIFRARQRMRTLLEKSGFSKIDFFLMLCAV